MTTNLHHICANTVNRARNSTEMLWPFAVNLHFTKKLEIWPRTKVTPKCAVIAIILVVIACTLYTNRYIENIKTRGQNVFPRIISSSRKLHENGFPRLLHHFNISWEPVKKKRRLGFMYSYQSCMNKSIGFTHITWDTASIGLFLKTYYPWFRRTFYSYDFPKQQIYSAVYFILYHYGGVYLELGVICKVSLDEVYSSFQPGSHVVLAGTSAPGGLSLSFMAAKPHHKLLFLALNSLQDANRKQMYRHLITTLSTGPVFLARCHRQYEESMKETNQLNNSGPLSVRAPNSDVYVMPERQLESFIGRVNQSYFHNLKSRWDSVKFVFSYEFIPSFIQKRYQ